MFLQRRHLCICERSEAEYCKENVAVQAHQNDALECFKNGSVTTNPHFVFKCPFMLRRMDSDEDHDHEHDEPDGGSANSTALTGFLFGNIDKEGKLEDDVLDEVRVRINLNTKSALICSPTCKNPSVCCSAVFPQESKRHLGSLTSLGIGSMVREITKDESGEDNSSTETSGSGKIERN